MTQQNNKLYRLQKNDIQKASGVLVDSFQQDPFWNIILKDANKIQKQAFFESPVKYCNKYGKVYAPSNNLEGIIAWVSSEFADMKFWQAVRSGSLFSIMKMGMKMAQHAMNIKTMLEPLDNDRKNKMKGKKYLYLIIFGVAFKLQGQGFGGKLMKALVKESEEKFLPIYVETTKEKSIKIYEKLGFRVISQIDLPQINLPQWGMIREPGT